MCVEPQYLHFLCCFGGTHYCCCGWLLYGLCFGGWAAFVLDALILCNFYLHWLHLFFCFLFSFLACCHDLCTPPILAHANMWLLITELMSLITVNSVIISVCMPPSFSLFKNCSFKCLSVSLYLHSAALFLVHPYTPLAFHQTACLVCNIAWRWWFHYAGVWIFQWIYAINYKDFSCFLLCLCGSLYKM